jgi:hypothetical protein
MSQDALEELLDRWLNDSNFREAYRSDPEIALKDVGLTLSPEEWAELRKIDTALPDEQLKPRVTRN